MIKLSEYYSSANIKLAMDYLDHAPEITIEEIENAIVRATANENAEFLSRLSSDESLRATISQSWAEAISSLDSLLGKIKVDVFKVSTAVRARIDRADMSLRLATVIDEVLCLYRTRDWMFYRTSDGYLVNFKYGRTNNI